MAIKQPEITMERIVKLFIAEKISLPKWVDKPTKHKRDIRNPEKLRKNRPAGEPAPAKAVDEPPAEADSSEAPAEESANTDKPAELSTDDEATKTVAENTADTTEPAGEPSPEADSADTKEDQPKEKSSDQA